jgi:hypothetical protein
MLEEPPLLGLAPFSHIDIESEIDLLEQTLVSRLLILAKAHAGRMTLFSPMGIGGHRNHVSILKTLVRAIPRLEPFYDIVFYEDLHYASHAEVRANGINHFLTHFQTKNPTRIAVTLDKQAFANKFEKIQIYRSQLESQHGPDSFIPAVSPSVAHEAVWILDPVQLKAV